VLNAAKRKTPGLFIVCGGGGDTWPVPSWRRGGTPRRATMRVTKESGPLRNCPAISPQGSGLRRHDDVVERWCRFILCCCFYCYLL